MVAGITDHYTSLFSLPIEVWREALFDYLNATFDTRFSFLNAG
jgi:hypothetical protein